MKLQHYKKRADYHRLLQDSNFQELVECITWSHHGWIDNACHDLTAMPALLQANSASINQADLVGKYNVLHFLLDYYGFHQKSLKAWYPCNRTLKVDFAFMLLLLLQEGAMSDFPNYKHHSFIHELTQTLHTVKPHRKSLEFIDSHMVEYVKAQDLPALRHYLADLLENQDNSLYLVLKLELHLDNRRQHKSSPKI